MPYHHHFILDELSPSGIAALVTNRLQGGQPSPLVLDLIQARADNNPFFTEELIDNLRMTGGLNRLDDGTWSLSEAVFNNLQKANCLAQESSSDQWVLSPNARLAMVDLGVPDSIHGLVLSRLDCQPEPLKLTLKVASVIGRTFELELLLYSHPDQPRRIHLPKQLAALEKQGLIYRVRLPQPTYIFKHQFTQEVVYKTLPDDQQRELHRLVAEGLERVFPEAVERLAYHFVQAEEGQKAFEYLVRAGDRAGRMYAPQEATGYYERASLFLPDLQNTNPHRYEWSRLILQRRLGRDLPKETRQAPQVSPDDQDLLPTLISHRPTSIGTSTPIPKTQQSIKAVPTSPAKSEAWMTPLLIGGILVILLCLVAGGLGTWTILPSSDGTVDDLLVVGDPVQENVPIAEEVTSTPSLAPTSTPSSTPTSTLSPTPTSTLSPTPTSIPTATATTDDSTGGTIRAVTPELVGEILFEEFFDSDANGWATGQFEDDYALEDVTIEGGVYTWQVTAKKSVAVDKALPNLKFSDFVLMVEVTPHNAVRGDHSYGVTFRKDSNGHFYSFEIDSDGFYMVSFFDGDWKILKDWSRSEAINVDKKNELKVVANGEILTFYVNDQQLTTIEDDTLSKGQVGLVVGIFEEGQTAVVGFDNLTVRQISDAVQIGAKKTPVARGPVETNLPATEEAAALPTSISTATTPPQPIGEILFEESFDSDANGWATGEFEYEPSIEEITIAEGVYTLQVTAKEPVFAERILPNLEYSDFMLTVETTPHDTDKHYSSGISFRGDGNFNSYKFEIGNDGLYAVLLFDGDWKTLKDWSSSEAINVGETNELKVIADGETLTFFVNDQLLTTLQDDTLSAGQVGLLVEMFEGGQTAAVDFDNLVIRQVE